MRFKELTKLVARETGITVVTAEKAIKCMAGVIIGSLDKGETTRIPKLGVFKIIKKGERIARNPKTGERITVPKRKRVAFSASATLIYKINKE